jgi:hypothetical protein
LIGFLKPLVEVVKRKLRRFVQDILQFHRQMRVALARIGMQIGEIGASEIYLMSAPSASFRAAVTSTVLPFRARSPTWLRI